MKVVILILIFALTSQSVVSQTLPTWFRVHTYDDSFIDMNTADIGVGGSEIVRARFRWTFAKPQQLGELSNLEYQYRDEIIDFDCSTNRMRTREIRFFDAGKKLIREELFPVDKWRSVAQGIITQNLYYQACGMLKRHKRNEATDPQLAELENVSKLAYDILTKLEQTRDIKPVIKQFFEANYLQGYLKDDEGDWFMLLDRTTATKASPGDLQRYYEALLNVAYRGSLYVVSKFPDADDVPITEEQINSPDLVQLIQKHPYSIKYKSGAGNYDYLAEKIDSVERMLIYTDLLEKIGELVGKKTKVTHAQLADYPEAQDNLFKPIVKTCTKECLGLPKGTRLFEVKVSAFRFQMAKLNGQLRVVSAVYAFD